MSITPQPVCELPYLPDGTIYRDRFGFNTTIDTNDVPEDIWSEGGEYPFPTAAATTTIESDSTDDDGDPAGDGAQTVYVSGLDTNYAEVEEIVTMNGTSAVTLSNSYLRVHRCYVIASGADGTNAGNITVQHGSTVIAAIPAGLGQTQAAVFTIPATTLDGRSVTDARMLVWRITAGAMSGSNEFQCGVRIRPEGESWRQIETKYINASTAQVGIQYRVPTTFAPGTDLVLRVFSGSGVTVPITGQFSFLLNT